MKADLCRPRIKASGSCSGLPSGASIDLSPHSMVQEFVGKRDTEAAQLGLLVRSGLYEVDLLLRLMTPGYWPEAQHRVSRGTWFVEKGHDWVPLKETVRHLLPAPGSPCRHPPHQDSLLPSQPT